MTAPLILEAPVSRLRAAFDRAQAAEHSALVGCLPAGFPTVERSVEALRVLGGHVDILEVGLPHHNPDFEIPATHGASMGPSGLTVADVLEVIRQVTVTVDVPVVLMSYWDPIAWIGAKPMAAALSSAGGTGLVLPGLHPRGPAAARWLAAAGRWLATTFTAADGVRRDAAEEATGWVSLPALSNRFLEQRGPARSTDGTRHDFAPEPVASGGGLLDLANLRGRALMLGHMTTTPICASGGISSPAQAEAIAPAVDGVVVRSAFVRSLQYARTFEEGLTALDQRASRYATAVRQGGRTTREGCACAHERCRSAAAA